MGKCMHITRVLLTLALCGLPGVRGPAADNTIVNEDVEQLLAAIDQGINVDHLKYKYLMTMQPKGFDRDAVIARVRERTAQEPDAKRKLLLESALAFGLARSPRDSVNQFEASKIYAHLLGEPKLMDQLGVQRNRIWEDFLTSNIAVIEGADNVEVIVAEFSASLFGASSVSAEAFARTCRTSPPLADRVIRLARKLGAENAGNRQLLYRTGGFFVASQAYAEALKYLTQAWTLGPEGDEEVKAVGNSIVKCHVRMRQLPRAIEAEQSLLARLTHRDCYVDLADLYRQTGDLEKMEGTLEMQLKESPSLGSRLAVSAVFLAASRFEKAEETLKEIPDVTADSSADIRPAVFAAAVIRARIAEKTGNAERHKRLLTDIMAKRAEFQALAGREIWLQAYYDEATGRYDRMVRATAPPKKE